MRVRRLAALVLALLVAGSGVSPCTAAAVARAGDAAPVQGPDAAHADPKHAAHAADAHSASNAHGSGDCHGPSVSISPRCECGCTGDGPRAAASPLSAPWALPAPTLARVEEGDAPAPPGRTERPTTPAPSRIDHVPIAS